MRELKIEDLKYALEVLKNRDMTIAYWKTTGCIHEGHIQLCRMIKEKCDRLFVFFAYYLPYIDYVTPGRYENLFESDCKKLDHIVDYAIKVPFSRTIGRLYNDHKSRCKQFDWPEGIHKSEVFVAVSTPMPYEEELEKFDIPAVGEKDALSVVVGKKLSEYYEQGRYKDPTLFPIVKNKGVCFDSTDSLATKVGEKEEASEQIVKIRSMVAQDKTTEEMSSEQVKVFMWSVNPLKIVSRLSKCGMGSFLTYKGRFNCGILKVSYKADGVGYSEDALFDSCGRFVLSEDISK